MEGCHIRSTRRTEAEIQRLRGQVDRLRRELDEVLRHINRQQEAFAKAAETLKFID
jgi:prefoldin subunit 5